MFCCLRRVEDDTFGKQMEGLGQKVFRKTRQRGL